MDSVDERRVGAAGYWTAQVPGDGEGVAGLRRDLVLQFGDDEVAAVDGGHHAAQDGDAECPPDLVNAGTGDQSVCVRPMTPALEPWCDTAA